jgi:hypothetical protein
MPRGGELALQVIVKELYTLVSVITKTQRIFNYTEFNLHVGINHSMTYSSY